MRRREGRPRAPAGRGRAQPHATARLRRGAAGLLLAWGLTGAPGVGAAPIVDSGPVRLDLGGYTRMLAGYQMLDLGALPEAARPPERIGLGASVLRLTARLDLGAWATIDVHDRVAWMVTSEALPTSAGVGLGATATPRRTVDLQTSWLDTPRLHLDQDVDRLVVRLYLGPVDLSVGRQAITWGRANLLTSTDVWAAFSPFELDTSQKRGIDAVRAVAALSERVELEAVVADRGRLADLSGGVRVGLYLDAGDVSIALAKVWDQLAVMADVSFAVGELTLRAEAFGAYDTSAGQFDLPRITAGVDWMPDATWMVTLEGQFDGLGATEATGYLQAATSKAVARGQTYLLGRGYVAAAVVYTPHPLVRLALAPIVNVQDPSALVAWSVAYDVAASVELSVGGFHGIGEPLAAPTPPMVVARSEFGSYGHFLYLQLAAFF